MAAAFYLLLAGHDVTVFERDPAPGGMLRYGIPQYRLPKVEVLEAEYESVTRLGGKMVCNAGLGRDFTLDDLTFQGFDAVVVAIGCYDTNKLGIPGEDAAEVLDGLEYLRTATLGLEYPNHAGKRVVVIGGGFTSMDCSRTSIRQGASEVTLVYRRDMKDMPASNEVHEAIEEGVTAIFQAGPVRVVTDDAGNVTGVEFIRMQPGAPDASGRRRPEPAPGTEFTVPCDRVLLAIGQGPELDWLTEPGNEGPQNARNRLKADAVTFETGRAGVFGTGDVRIGASTVVQAIAEGRRAAYAVDAYVKGLDLSAIRTRQTLAEPQPEFLSIVPFTSEAKTPRYRLTALEAEERNHSYIEYELPYTREAAVAESTRCLQCTCEAIGFCDLRRLGIEYGTTLQTLEPQYHQGAGLSERHREPVHRRQPRLHPRRFARVHPPRAVALHRLRPVRERLRRGRRSGLLRLHADRLRHARHDAARHEPQRHAVRLVRTLRRDVPDRRADAEAAGPAEVRGRREPLHPVRHLRGCMPVRRSARRGRHGAVAHQPRAADDRPDGDRRHRSRDRGDLHPARAGLGGPGCSRGPLDRPRAAAGCPAVLDRWDQDERQRPGCARRPRPAQRTQRAWRPRRHGGDHADPPRVAGDVLRKLIPIVLALAVMGAVFTIAAIMLVLLGQDWGDALFFIFAAVLVGAGLLVVTMRDIIRCGLAMIVCFGALAGIYVILGSPLVAAAQVIVYIGAISVLILFAIMLTQTKDAPTRLVFQTQAVPAAIASVVIAVLIALAVVGH